MKKFLLLFFFLSTPAGASTFCHIETSECLDPQVNETIGQYLARYTAPVESGWNVVVAPDGTKHGASAVPDGNGGYVFTNPTPVNATVPAVLNKAAFQRYAYVQLGALQLPNGSASQQMVAGITRYGQIILAIKASTDPATAAAYDAYTSNISFDFPYVALFLATVGPSPGSGITTSTENAAILGNWPVQ